MKFIAAVCGGAAELGGVRRKTGDRMLVPLVVYVDVDDTLIRTAGSKRIPVSGVTEHVRALAAAGAELYCWSAGGGAYARSVAEGLGIAECFKDFLPKPQVLIDDVALAKWNRLVEVHPAQCGRWTALTYQRVIAGELLNAEPVVAAVTAAEQAD